MSIVSVGVSHKSGPVNIRESLAEVGAAQALERLRARNLTETVVLSTCNRFEIYTTNNESNPEKLLSSLSGILSNWTGVPLDDYIYRLSDDAAVRHLFSVAAGLESLVVGESEILGQVKQAYEQARSLGRTGKITNVLFQRALYVGKMVRTKTGISTGQSSVASTAVALAERIFGNLKASSVLILGAGKMAELTAKHLLSGKVAKLYLANRTLEKAKALAAQFRAEVVPWENFPKLLETVDIVIASTGSTKHIIGDQMVHAAVPARRGRSLFIIDIAMPRDVEETVHQMDRVYLYTLENLSGIVNENLSRRHAEISSAEAMVQTQASEFWTWFTSVSSGAQAGLHHAPSGKSAEKILPSPFPAK